jgi:integrase-like protein
MLITFSVLRTYSAAASLPLLAHPHMLRHACGFALADQGADTRLIQHHGTRFQIASDLLRKPQWTHSRRHSRYRRL